MNAGSRSFLVIVAGALLLAATSGGLRAQSPSLEDLLELAGTTFQKSTVALSNVVANEEYSQQEAVVVSGFAKGVAKRQLKSDVLLVRYPGSDADWMFFRDVLEVDRQPLQQTSERLLRLFVNPPPDVRDQMTAIAAESLEHHLSGGSYPVTNPFVGTALVQPHYRPRLNFSGGDLDRSAGRGVRVVRFKERDTPGDPSHKPMFGAGLAEGSIWIDQANGRVVKTEVWPVGRGSGPRDPGRPVSTTTFVFNDRLGVMMPSEMHTSWAMARERVVTGVATYGTFKRFTVDANTTRIVIPPAQR